MVSILLIYAFLLLLAYIFQARLIFYPGKLPDDYSFNLPEDAEEVRLITDDGKSITGLFYPGSLPEVILYFHGNAGDLSGWQYISEDFTRHGFSFLIIDYRGYGKSTGTLSESGLCADAEAAYRYLLDSKGFSARQILLYGRSIGTGVAVELAANNMTGGLILEAPFTSLKKLAAQKMPVFLPFLLLRYSFNNMEKINRVNVPLLILHGDHDNLIPPSHGRALLDRFGGKKKLVIIENGRHNDLNHFEKYHSVLRNIVPEFFELAGNRK